MGGGVDEKLTGVLALIGRLTFTTPDACKASNHTKVFLSNAKASKTVFLCFLRAKRGFLPKACFCLKATNEQEATDLRP